MNDDACWTSEVSYLTESLVVPLMRTPRHNKVPFSGRAESVAEHSFHVACVVAQLSIHFPEIDAHTCLRMALQHDFGEAVTGDVSVYASESERAQKSVNEHDAVRKVMRCSREAGVTVSPLVQYVEHTSKEAGFVCAIDKIVPYFLVMAGQGHHAHPSPKQYAETRARARAHITRCFERLLPLFDEVAERVAKRVDELARSGDRRRADL